MTYFALFISLLSLGFSIYKTPVEAKNYLICIVNFTPLIFTIIAAIMGLITFVLSILAIFGIIQHQCSTIDNLLLFYIMSITTFAAFHATKFFYSEFKKPITF